MKYGIRIDYIDRDTYTISAEDFDTKAEALDWYNRIEKIDTYFEAYLLEDGKVIERLN